MSALKVMGSLHAEPVYAGADSLLMVKPEQLVLLLLYVQEVTHGGRKGPARFKSIDFFLRRAGGMHLLLLLPHLLVLLLHLHLRLLQAQQIHLTQLQLQHQAQLLLLHLLLLRQLL